MFPLKTWTLLNQIGNFYDEIDPFHVYIFQVVSEYRERGMDFVLQAINHPTYLEDLTGLTELMKSANSFQLDWDNEIDDDDCVEI